VAFDDQQHALAWNHEYERVTGYQVRNDRQAGCLSTAVRRWSQDRRDCTREGPRSRAAHSLQIWIRTACAWLSMLRELTSPWLVAVRRQLRRDRPSPGGRRRMGPGVGGCFPGSEPGFLGTDGPYTDKEYIGKDGSPIVVSIRLFLVRGANAKPIGGGIVKPQE
jgi:hypothetical protein